MHTYIFSQLKVVRELVSALAAVQVPAVQILTEEKLVQQQQQQPERLTETETEKNVAAVEPEQIEVEEEEDEEEEEIEGITGNNDHVPRALTSHTLHGNYLG